MSKKRRAKKKAAVATESSFFAGLSLKKLLMIGAGVIALLLAAVSINAYESGQQELHDLSVIGQGEPVIVQIHDPNCPTCRRLKSAVTNALKSNDTVLYRLADIKTERGKALQNQYAVPHVTLLFFNGAGRHVHTTSGLQTSAQVSSAVDRFLPPPS